MAAIVTSRLHCIFFFFSKGLFTRWWGHCRLMKWHLPFVRGGGQACQVVIKPDSANWLRVGTPFV